MWPITSSRRFCIVLALASVTVIAAFNAISAARCLLMSCDVDDASQRTVAIMGFYVHLLLLFGFWLLFGVTAPVLNSLVDDSILKCGITDLVGNEQARYSPREWTSLNARMTVIATFSSRAPARMLEMMLCYGSVVDHGHLPPQSKRC